EGCATGPLIRPEAPPRVEPLVLSRPPGPPKVSRRVRPALRPAPGAGTLTALPLPPVPASRLPLPLLLFALALSGCGSNAFTLYLNSSESESPILTTTALDGPRDTLIHAKQVRLTFSSASVYLAGILARTPDPESELGWVELLSEPLSIDLINLRGDQLRKLGEGTLPAVNTLSQIRLRLQAPEPAVDG